MLCMLLAVGALSQTVPKTTDIRASAWRLASKPANSPTLGSASRALEITAWMLPIMELLMRRRSNLVRVRLLPEYLSLLLTCPSSFTNKGSPCSPQSGYAGHGHCPAKFFAVCLGKAGKGDSPINCFYLHGKDDCECTVHEAISKSAKGC